MFIAVALFATMFIGSCGNKAGNATDVVDSVAVDSIEVVDSVAVDTTVVDSTVCPE